MEGFITNLFGVVDYTDSEAVTAKGWVNAYE
jgi:hypothetical protein